MTRFRKALIVRLLFVVVFLVSGCSAIAPVDLTGGWSAQLLWTSGPANGFISPFTMELVLESRTLSGTLRLPGPGAQTFELPIGTGQAKGSSMTLTASGTNPLVNPSPTVSITLDGDYSADAMSGTGSQTIDGNTYTFTWEAVRVSGPPTEATAL